MSLGEDSDELTLEEAGRMLQVLPRTLERWARDGRIPSRLRADGVRIFRRSDLLSRSGAVGGAPPRSDSKGGDGPT